MKKLLLNIFMFITLVTTSNLLADDFTYCGAKQSDKNSVNPSSFEICKQDKAFRFLYLLMPKAFDDNIFHVFNFGELEDLKNDPEIVADEQAKNFSNFLIIIGKTLFFYFPLVLYASGFVYVAILGALNIMSEGRFFPESSGMTMKTFLVVIFATTVLLFPLGDYAFIQILILTIATFALSLGNYLFGVFLADIEVEAFGLQENMVINQLDLNATVNGQAGTDYATNMIKIANCRNVTSQALLQQSVFELRSDNIELHRNCTAGIIDNVEIANSEFFDTNILNNNSAYPSFINHDLKEVDYAMRTAISSTDYVYFGIKRQKDCSIYEYTNYECGSIPVTTPNLYDDGLINLIGKQYFGSIVKSTVDSVILNGVNNEIIYRGWMALKTKADTVLENSLDKDNDTKEYKLAFAALKNGNSAAYKRMSYYYHQLVLNGMTTGLVNASKTKNVGVATLDQTSTGTIVLMENVKAIVSDFSRATKIAKMIEKRHCMTNSKGLASSYLLIQQLKSGDDKAGATTRCIDFDTYSNYGLDSDNRPMLFRENVREIEGLKDDILKEVKSFATEITQRKNDVEKSFTTSLQDINNRSVLVDLRKQGFIVLATYMMEIARELKTNEKFFTALTSSNNFNHLTLSSRMIADYVEDIQVEDTNFLSYNDNSDIYNKIPRESSNENNNNSMRFTQSLIENNQEEIFRGEITLLDFLDTLFTNPIPELKAAIGNNADVTSDPDYLSIMELCVKDIANCPIAHKEPIAELNQYGHGLIKQSLYFFGVIGAVKGFSYLSNSATNAKNKAAKKDGKLGKLGKSKGAGKATAFTNTISNSLDGSVNVLSYLSFFVAIMLLAGFYLAYILPVTLSLYFLMAFLNWLILVLQFTFMSSVLVSKAIRWGDEKTNLKKTFYTYFIKIFFVPLFMVVGFLVGWHLLKIVLFFFSIMLDLVLQTTATDSIITGMFNSIVGVALLILSVFLSLKFSFKLINDIPNTLLKKLDAMSNDSNQNILVDVLQMKMGVAALDSISDGVKEMSTGHKDEKAQSTNKSHLEKIRDEENKK